MGFFDSMAGLGRSLWGGIESIGSGIGGFIEDVAPIIGPPLAQAGAEWLIGQIPGPSGAPSGYPRTTPGYSPYFPTYPGGGVVPTQPYAPRAMPVPTLGPNGGFPMPTFPASPAVGYSNGWARPVAGVGIPGTDWQIEADLPYVDFSRRPNGAAAPGPGCPTTPFRTAPASMRAQAFVQVNPATGRATWFKPAGRPILWSDDLRACKRVGRIAARARRSRRSR